MPRCHDMGWITRLLVVMFRSSSIGLVLGRPWALPRSLNCKKNGVADHIPSLGLPSLPGLPTLDRRIHIHSFAAFTLEHSPPPRVISSSPPEAPSPEYHTSDRARRPVCARVAKSRGSSSRRQHWSSESESARATNSGSSSGCDASPGCR